MKSRPNLTRIGLVLAILLGGLHTASAFYDPGSQRWLNRDPAAEEYDINLYSYVYNSPPEYVDADGLCGGGVVGGGAAEAGVIYGGALNGSIGAGFFAGGGKGLHGGAFRSGGAFVGGPGFHAGQPSGQPQTPVVGGAYAGAGVGAFFTNANSASQLRGPFSQWNFNIGIGPIKVSVSFAYSNGIGIASITFGPGAYVSGSGYPTTCRATE